MTDAADYRVNKMRFLLRFHANLSTISRSVGRGSWRAHTLQTKQIPFSEVWNLVAGCQVTKIPGAFSTTSVIPVSRLCLPSEEAFKILIISLLTLNDFTLFCHLVQTLTHPDKKHLLPHTVTSLRLSLHAELIGTPAGGVVCDVSHLSWEKLRQSCFHPDSCDCES